jgi:hypothetical protein
MRYKLRKTKLLSGMRAAVTKYGKPFASRGASGRRAAKSVRRCPEWVLVWAGFVLAVLVAFGLRAFRLNISWEIYVDELDYLQISQGVLQTGWVIGKDGPFYLHPPLFFFLEAAYMKLFGIGGDLIQQLHGVRYLGAALAGCSAGALLWVGRSLAGWSAGIAAAAIFTLDPFSIRLNSLNILENPSMLWVLLGYGVLFSALVQEDRRSVAWWRVVTAGVMFGLALLNKEVSAFITLLPLGTCFVFGWALPRARSALAGVTALAVYAPYWAVVYAIGDWPLFVEKKLDGVMRLMGAFQTTGFNQQGGPSFLGALVSRLDEYATTYTLLATGALAVCVLLLTDLGKAPDRRLLLSLTASAYALFAYITIFGTLEDHFFYYLIIPAILATTVTAALLLQKARARNARKSSADAFLGAFSGPFTRSFTNGVFAKVFTRAFADAFQGVVRSMFATRRRRLSLKFAAALPVAALAFWSSYVWTVAHTVPDNGYHRVTSYVERLPESETVAITSQTGEILFEEHAGDGAYSSVEALRATNVDYVVMDQELVAEGWKEPPPELYRWVKNHGQLVYSFVSISSSGVLGVWSLQEGAGDATPAPDGAPTPREVSRRCEGSREQECVRRLVARVAPEAEYVRSRIDLNADGPGQNRNVLYFEDTTLRACEYTMWEGEYWTLQGGVNTATTSYTVIIAGEGSYGEEQNGRNCVPEPGQ